MNAVPFTVKTFLFHQNLALNRYGVNTSTCYLGAEIRSSPTICGAPKKDSDAVLLFPTTTAFFRNLSVYAFYYRGVRDALTAFQVLVPVLFRVSPNIKLFSF